MRSQSEENTGNKIPELTEGGDVISCKLLSSTSEENTMLLVKGRFRDN